MTPTPSQPRRKGSDAGVRRTVGVLVVGLVLAGLAGCASQNVTTPERSASEQLLISTAADRAAESLAETLPVTGPVYVDAINFDGYDERYAIGAIRDALLRNGARLTQTREAADTIVEIRAGALSIDREEALVGMPSLTLPIPLSDTVSTPELAVFKKDLAQGVAKIAATAYDAETGALVASTGPTYGFSNKAVWTLLLVLTWDTSDLIGDDARPSPEPWE
ncbi:hypothetical protein F1188_07025 [Roseospira marina]|uniref:Uncharacterized protein n=1 Tax=Roseospira marina TaxID=140057 RepID=A0A5M6IDM4_9PROT|nr:DUF6655 family protein [Roseospira marina]KAA5606172.1 hypothetical protein F1188_07025 [Roseospira marina]MBB4314314.1 hypothetical protein [Roseospira marina]MBB5087474.1 hypothetical protein [Roseospira marina]